jgi:hypothetical protein
MQLPSRTFSAASCNLRPLTLTSPPQACAESSSVQAPPWHHLRADARPDLLPELDSAASGLLSTPASPTKRAAAAAAAAASGGAADAAAGAAGGAAGEEFAALLPANTLVFGIRGQQAREGDAPSYFNAIEASTVADLVESLISSTAGEQHCITGRSSLRWLACMCHVADAVSWHVHSPVTAAADVVTA